MPPPDTQHAGFSSGRRWLIRLNLLVATAAALALVVMLNYLAQGYYIRFPWSEAAKFKLSGHTLHVLNALTNDVTVTIFYQRKADVYMMTCDLLAEYQQINPSRIHLVVLDYDKSPAEAADLLGRLHLGPGQKDFVAFECKSNGQHKICQDIKLSSYDLNDLTQHREVRRTAFLGERFFTSYIWDR